MSWKHVQEEQAVAIEFQGQVVDNHHATSSAADHRDGSEGELEVVNAVLKAPLRVESYLRHRETLERVHWTTPLESERKAMETIIAMAQVRSVRLCTPCTLV